MFDQYPILNIWIPLFDPKFPLVLFCSQKSGCTSLSKWFYFQLDLLKEAESVEGVHWYTIHRFTAQDDYKQRLTNHIKKKDCYKLVRNPYRRAVSAYIQVLTTQTDEYKKIKNFLYNDPNSHQGVSFKQFIHYVQHTLPGGVIDAHCFPQYFPGEEELIKKNYLYLEKFNDEIAAIEKRYGLKKSHPSLFVSPHHNSQRMIMKGNFSEFKFTREMMISGKKLPTYESFYDQEVKDSVRSIYDKDFETYGYDDDL
ncbi:sulfotransferase family 2 domain-containing protein [Lihuaxuella thermophila]|uniref:Sulfotransferase family protein n=1 Tax=Lihuaxuella thermophila TaxID=1173111 RepID=A0A1H8DYS8_9BACL|nr:sulfotransferase family 2 domain-containing protein [Lihuaxuella thermophila]SEN12316.1 Sulfotransferase family protein [Lihuaxuella thermophila]